MIPLLVLGLGNPILGDDGVGPRTVAALGALGGLPEGTRLVDGGTAGLGLLADLEEAEHVIIVDAVDLGPGAPPGEIVRFENEGLRLARHIALSPHQIGLRDVLSLCRLRGTTPPHLVLLGVQVASVAPRMELSPGVEAAVPALLDAVRREAARQVEADAFVPGEERLPS